jgi:hypothetical protein
MGFNGLPVTHGLPSLCSQSSQSQLPFETRPCPVSCNAIACLLYNSAAQWEGSHSYRLQQVGEQVVNEEVTKSVRFKMDVKAEAKGGKIGLLSPSQAVGE